jgi:signal transduction histidine kinase
VLPQLRIAFSESVDRGVAARAAAFLFLIAGVLGLAALAFPGGEGTSAAAGAATSLVALALGIPLWFFGSRLPAWAYQHLGIAAAALASISAYYGGAEGWLNGFFLFWIALFIAYFFTFAAVVLQTIVIAATYALALALNDAIAHRGLIWFLTVTTVAVTAAVVAALRVRLEHALEAEHRQVEHLLELDRMKNDFIATVSHELRTPVAAVYGAAATLLMRELPQRKQTELLRVAHQESLRLTELVESLLTSVSLDHRQLSFNLERVDAGIAALEAVEAARAREPGRTIEFGAAAGALHVVADPLRLHQALAAVLDNALKYSSADDPISVYVGGDEHHIRISVTDRGRGIPAPEREHVFDKFYRLDPQMKTGVGGSGLGLHIVRGLINGMDGSVWIQAGDDGRGTAVVLQLRPSEAAAQVAL